MAGPERSVSDLGTLQLPALGLGGASVGNLYKAISEDAARATLEAAIDAGLSLFDTAPHYGAGLSEKRIGAFLADRSERPRISNPLISTKVGRRLVDPVDDIIEDHGFVDAEPFNPVFDYSADGVRASFEGSLDRLRLDRVDLLLLHDIGAMVHGEASERVMAQSLAEALPEMIRIRETGGARAVGIGVNEIEVCQELLRQVDLDVILLAGRYTLLEPEAAIPLLDLCLKRGTQVIIGGPFNSGLLVSGEGDKAVYNYAPAPQWALERREQLSKICANHTIPLAAAALQYPLKHPAVSCVIPGAQSALEVGQIKAWFDDEIPDALWDDLKDARLIPEEATAP